MSETLFYDLVISGRLRHETAERLLDELSCSRVKREENRTCFLNLPVYPDANRVREAVDAEIDVAVIPSGLSISQFRCAFFDMDSTLIENECIDELAKLCGVVDQVAEITESSMRGELDFEQSLRSRVKLLAGAPADIIDEAFSQIRPTAGARETVAWLQDHGIKSYVLSGGFAQFASRIAADYGMNDFVCNNLVIENGRLTGEVTGPAGGGILDRRGKRRAMEIIAQLNRAQLSQCIAGGDGANDLEMIEAAGFGFAYHAKPVVAQAAPRSIRFGTFAVLKDWFVED